MPADKGTSPARLLSAYERLGEASFFDELGGLLPRVRFTANRLVADISMSPKTLTAMAMYIKILGFSRPKRLRELPTSIR